MRVQILLCCAAALGFAHEAGLSTGELAIDGAVAQYTLHLPDGGHHVNEPERVLLGAIEIAGARLAERKCREGAGESVLCEGKFVFAAEPERIDIRVHLHEALATEHLHILTVSNRGSLARTTFDARHSHASLDLRRMGSLRSIVESRPAMGIAIACAILALGASTHIIGVVAFIAGAFIAHAIPVPVTPWYSEALMAILGAYLGFEALVMPRAGKKWIPALMLGFAMGLYLIALVPALGSRASLGAIAAVLGTLMIPVAIRTRVLAIVLLGGALVWFFVLMVQRG